METNFNFKSQICTDKIQSERLLALGLKKETADMCWQTTTLNGEPITYPSQDIWLNDSIITDNHFPAWSLGKLIELMPRTIVTYFPVTSGTRIERFIYAQGILTSDDSIAEAVSIIEWLIKGGYFNKEYLV